MRRNGASLLHDSVSMVRSTNLPGSILTKTELPPKASIPPRHGDQGQEIPSGLVVGGNFRFDHPALGKGIFNLLPCHFSRPLRSRLLSAEAKKEQPSARLEDRSQPCDVFLVIPRLKNVEQYAVVRLSRLVP